MNISIIIPNYNGEALLKKNIPTVFAAAQQYAREAKSEVEIIIVDDKSADKSIEIIEHLDTDYSTQHVRIKLIENTQNLGFSQTVNIGVKHAKGEIIVLLNSDVRPEKNFLFPLVSHFSDETVFAVGCLEKSIEKDKEVLRGRGIGKWEKGFLFHQRGEVDKTTTLWVSGGSGAFRKSSWEKLGGFIEVYKPYYWEDNDLSYRALKAGHTIIFEPQSIIAHEHEAGSIKSTQKETKVQQIAYRNQFFFVWINVTDFSLILSHIFWLPYHIINAVRRKDTAFLLGMASALLSFSQILKVRKRVQKSAKRSDRDVVAEFVKEISA